MSVPIPLRREFSAALLRGLAKKTKDGPQARRLLTLAAIYDVATRSEAAKIGGVGLQIIRDWVLRFNARGPEGPNELTFCRDFPARKIHARTIEATKSIPDLSVTFETPDRRAAKIWGREL